MTEIQSNQNKNCSRCFGGIWQVNSKINIKCRVNDSKGDPTAIYNMNESHKYDAKGKKPAIRIHPVSSHFINTEKQVSPIYFNETQNSGYLSGYNNWGRC